VSTTALRGPLSSVDWRTWPDGSPGNGWIDGHTWNPAIYDPVGVRDGAIVCTDPTARTGANYALDQTVTPPAGGQQHVGIGCMWRPTIYTAPTVTITWAGYNQSAAWIEATPLIHVTPGTTEHGFGMWLSRFGSDGGPPFVIAGSIGNPPEVFGSLVLATASFTHATQGQERTFEMRSTGTGVTGWMDGVQLSFSTYGTGPIPIPTALRGSTMHGLAVDTHLTTDWDDIPLFPAAYDWSIE
jgi:hypothetical protein